MENFFFHPFLRLRTELSRHAYDQRAKIRRRFLTERHHEVLSLVTEERDWGPLGDLWTKRTIGAQLINLLTLGRMLPEREEKGRLHALAILSERIREPYGSLGRIELNGRKEGHTVVKLTPHAQQLLHGSEDRHQQIRDDLATRGLTRRRI
ncbi:MAG TPA: hypothetical protein VN711_02225 [Candidatus Saccharimonadales bacterium]|nr:hypothetical protein [Candidatus Saccharimonadales bacterium]